MRQIPEVGDVVVVKKFAFNNKAGGTGLSDWQFDEKFVGEARVTVAKAWHDYETGWRYHGTPMSRALVEYLERNAQPHKPIYFGEYDVQKEIA